MDLILKPVTPENRRQAEELTVLNSQKSFIETVSECMNEADGSAAWHPLVIEHGGTMIGFAMYGYFPQSTEGKLWFDRFLIDKNYQHRGYGKQSVALILKTMHRHYPEEDIYLSVYEDNPCAISLYQSFGFHFNGALDINGEKVMVLPRDRIAH